MKSSKAEIVMILQRFAGESGQRRVD